MPLPVSFFNLAHEVSNLLYYMPSAIAIWQFYKRTKVIGPLGLGLEPQKLSQSNFFIL
jgi:hypothetical protein